MKRLVRYLRARLLPCLPVLAVAGLVITGAAQSACSSDDEKCTSTRSGCRVESTGPETFYLDRPVDPASPRAD